MEPSKPRSAVEAPSALLLIEEAVQLLRSAPGALLVLNYLGAVPWTLGVMFFWAYATWFAPSGVVLAWCSLGLVFLFVLLKTCQALFASRLLALRSGTEVGPVSFRKLMSLAAAQLRIQAWAMLLLPLSAVLVFPSAWVTAYFQSATVLALDEVAEGDEKLGASAQASLWPGQNHLGLLSLCALGGIAWLNLAVAFLAVPYLARTLLGIDNIFGMRGWWVFNSNFWVSTVMLSWLAVDPLVKSFYAVRVFHGRCRRTGEDLHERLVLSRRRGSGLRTTIMRALLGFVLLAGPVCLLAQEKPVVPSATPVVEKAAVGQNTPKKLQPVALKNSLEEVLNQQEFQWRLRPLPRSAKDDGSDSAFVRFVVETLRILGGWMKSIGSGIGNFFDWVKDFFPNGNSASPNAPGVGLGAGLTVLLYVLAGVAVLLIVYVCVLIARQMRRYKIPVVQATSTTTALPDLTDENVQASQLPADGWLDLARQQMAAGDWRLALRALYLATLARLAQEELIRLARYKTNLDYEGELRRRAAGREELLKAFSVRRRHFDAVWYGMYTADQDEVKGWLAEMEKGGPL